MNTKQAHAAANAASNAAAAPTAASGTDAPADWTQGTPGIAYQRCGSCGNVWYFRREFCPRCGSDAPTRQASAGNGTIHATSLVYRAPDDTFRALAPYLVVLVDIDEGFRMMAHADPGSVIGDRVAARFETRAGRLMPVFGKEST